MSKPIFSPAERTPFGLKVLILALLVGASPSPSPAPQVSFSSEKYGFAITYPDSFESVPLPSPSVGLLIKSKSLGFPTFNVIALPGDNEPSNAQSPEQNLLDNYRQVGILDAAIARSGKATISGVESFTSEVTYKNSGEAFVSSVAVVPGAGRHYVLTFIDRAANFDVNKPVRDQLWAAFQASHAAVDVDGLSAHGAIFGWLALLAVVVVVGLRLIFLKLNYINRSKQS